MVKYKDALFPIIILFFLAFSFYPTLFDLSLANNLGDPNREYVLEHNYYWPDYNLYLSKIRQGFDGRLTALEKYTSEPHHGSLIQEFYVVLGLMGRLFSLDPNFSYLLARIILAPLLLLLILIYVRFYFKSFKWQIIAFLTVIVSASFPRFYLDNNGLLQIGRYMEWWSNIDSLQRITFIPHILFGQIVSFYLLFQFISYKSLKLPKLIILIILGNLTGLVFPPSLITLNGVIILTTIFAISSKIRAVRLGLVWLLFIIFTFPSLLYIFLLTKEVPWSALLDFHRTHPMMIPFWQYILGTGPIFFLGIAGAILSIVKRDRQYQPLIFWIIITFAFAILFTHLKDQSPLRFTQTGLYIPLGILGAYLFYEFFLLSDLSHLSNLIKKTIKVSLTLVLSLYLLTNLYMMYISLKWQTNWLIQRARANIPLVPYPPQAMFPLKNWMEAIRWLHDNTNHNEVVLAEITAANYIPAYSGNTVYFGQANTYDYERKQMEVKNFFEGKMTKEEAKDFLTNGRIKYVFYSIQEKEESGGKNLESIYPFVKPVFNNQTVTIYKLE